MRDHARGLAAAPGRAAMIAAAVATVVTAAGMDVLAGEHPLHSVTVGLIAVVVAAMRVRSPGPWRGHVDVLSGAIVAQPALHAASKLIPATPELVDGHAVESSVSVAHVMLAALVVAVVTGAERLCRALSAVRPLARLLAVSLPSPAPRGPAVRPRRHRAVRLVRRLVVADVSLRGPPVASLAAV